MAKSNKTTSAKAPEFFDGIDVPAETLSNQYRFNLEQYQTKLLDMPILESFIEMAMSIQDMKTASYSETLAVNTLKHYGIITF
jgi:hypothetical protein